MTLPDLPHTLRAWRDGAVGRIEFANPAKRNAISLAMWRGLEQAVAAFETDPAIRLLILSGSGEKAFSAGADISEFDQVRADPPAVAAYETAVVAAEKRLKTCAKPTLAMIRGYCVGGGLSVALECDLRYADTTAVFAIPAARLGLAYGAKGLTDLLAVVGPAAAKEILFTGRHFSAAEAAAMGLVNRVVEPDALATSVADVAAAITANAPLTIAAAKRTVNELLAPESERDMAACRRLMDKCFASADYTEGRRAFAEKRSPRFTGR